jgi:hypothetical protein
MSEEAFEQIERQIAAIDGLGSPRELRAAVLASVNRELRAARWDRRLGRMAAVLLVVGIGLNVAIGQPDGSGGGETARVRRSEARPSLVDTAIVLAEATDAVTAQRFARQMAAMTGRELTADEAAAIEAAVRRPASRNTPRNRG